MVFQGTYDPSFTIELQNKDNQLGYQIAKKYNASDVEHLHDLELFLKVADEHLVRLYTSVNFFVNVNFAFHKVSE